MSLPRNGAAEEGIRQGGEKEGERREAFPSCFLVQGGEKKREPPRYRFRQRAGIYREKSTSLDKERGRGRILINTADMGRKKWTRIAGRRDGLKPGEEISKKRKGGGHSIVNVSEGRGGGRKKDRE